jgi:hypothetical protein
MPVVRRRALLLAIPLAAVTVAGCGGGPPADLFVVQRDGSLPGARLTVRLTDDGGAYCNRMDRREITSAQLIAAREVRRELNGPDAQHPGPAHRGVSLPPQPGSVLRYEVLSEGGKVAFADNSRGAPATFGRLVKLTRDVARGPCGLPR